jgi:hypothetical protein
MENIRGFIAANSPEWGFTSMTTGKARGKKSKYGFKVRRDGPYKNKYRLLRGSEVLTFPNPRLHRGSSLFQPFRSSYPTTTYSKC